MTLCVAVLSSNAARAAGASKLVVSGITTPRSAGSAGTVTVEARTSSGARATSYTGTIRFSSTDSQAVLPANYTFTTADAGIHTFTNAVVLKTAATQSVTATDTVTASITGSQTGIVVNALSVFTLDVSGISTPRTVNFASSVTVEARDAYGNRATGYSGTIHFASSDPAAALPANYKFASGDAGIHTFTNGVVLKTVGAQSVTATDTTTASISGREKGIQVVSNAATSLVISGV